MHHTKKDRAENTLQAIAVMTAYYAEEGSDFASKIATDYANEPDGLLRLLDGFVHMSARLVLTVEAELQITRNEVLQLLAKAVTDSGNK